MKKLRYSTVFLSGLLLMGVATVPAHGAPAPEADVPAASDGKSEITRAIHESWGKKPSDYTAMNEAVVAAGGEPIKVSFPKAEKEQLSATQADAEIDSAVAMALPLDIFNVSSVFGGAAGGNETVLTYTGLWDFRDDFAGGDDGDDVSAVAVEHEACWTPNGDYASAWDYAGRDQSAKIYRKTAPFKSSVWGVRDQVFNFYIPTDHGAHTMQVKSSVPCTWQTFGGNYYYEHNQEGSKDAWSAQVGYGFLSVSYGGSSGLTLQKGTPFTTMGG